MEPPEVENLLLESRMPSYRSPESRSKPNIVTNSRDDPNENPGRAAYYLASGVQALLIARRVMSPIRAPRASAALPGCGLARIGVPDSSELVRNAP